MLGGDRRPPISDGPSREDPLDLAGPGAPCAGGQRAIDIVCHSPVEAATLLAAIPGVTRAADHEGSLRVTLSPEAPVDREIVTALLRRLLDHGVEVERVAPVRSTLEERFLTMTTRLEDRS